MKRKMLLFIFALPFIVLQNASAQIPSRLIGQAHWSSNGIIFSPVDSTDYIYSNGRGGSLNLDPTMIYDNLGANDAQLNYDNATYWLFSGDSAYVSLSYSQAFDANNNDTSTTTQLPDGTPYTKTLATYNAGNMITSLIAQTWDVTAWLSQTQHIYSYNANGKLYSDLLETYDSVAQAFDTSSQKTYYYDSSLNMTDEIDLTWIAGVPTYNHQWQRTYATTIAGTSQLLTTTLSAWNGTAWAPIARYSHDYDSTGAPVSLVIQNYDGATLEWDNTTLFIYSNFNGSQLPQTVVRKQWSTAGIGSWVSSMQYAYTYNTFNQVTSSTGISFNISANDYEYASGDPADNYYYESSTTAVTSIANTGGQASIYPVPAQSTLHIDLSWTVAQSATITVTDVTGQVVRTIHTPATTQYNGTMPVNDLAAGMYMIRINGEQGQIVKRIIVAH